MMTATMPKRPVKPKHFSDVLREITKSSGLPTSKLSDALRTTSARMRAIEHGYVRPVALEVGKIIEVMKPSQIEAELLAKAWLRWQAKPKPDDVLQYHDVKCERGHRLAWFGVEDDKPRCPRCQEEEI